MNVPGLRIRFTDAERAEIAKRVETCLTTGQIAQGRNVGELEDAMAGLVGTRHAVAVSSGGTAIQATMRALDVRGKTVLAPDNTFLATVAGVLHEGGRVRLVDSAPSAAFPSLDDYRAAFEKHSAGSADSKVSGVVVVHIGGLIPADIEDIAAWCEAEGLWLFEDCAHAHGSHRGDTPAGRFGVAGAYSFFATKVVTSGEGGMVVTDDDALAHSVRMHRDYGKGSQWVTYNEAVGCNWRMGELSAAIGVVHLRALEAMQSRRTEITALYRERLEDSPLELVLPDHPASGYKVIALLPAGVDRSELKASLKERGVGLPGGVYDLALHQQPALEGRDDVDFDGDYPHAADFAARHVCLPVYPSLTDDEALFAADQLAAALA
ncbi:MAG: DegT/DnrJ/EryC1/StrS family aminotransferase [Acidobacteriota bacterium]